MASWVLIPSLISLRDEINTLTLGLRDKLSDGAIGDQAHSDSSSDHNPDETGRTPFNDSDSINEVHAIDVDKDLRKAGWSMDRIVEIIVTRHRNGQDDRLQNVIWNRRIWSANWGWTARTYSGPNAHTEHAHFSGKYTTAEENDTRPWGLLEADGDDMATITQTDFNARMDAWWTARMSPTAADNEQRTALRVSGWQQEVGRTGVSTHNVLFGEMKTAINATLVVAQATADMLTVFVKAEQTDDLKNSEALAKLQASISASQVVLNKVLDEVHDDPATPSVI